MIWIIAETESMEWQFLKIFRCCNDRSFLYSTTFWNQIIRGLRPLADSIYRAQLSISVFNDLYPLYQIFAIDKIIKNKRRSKPNRNSKRYLSSSYGCTNSFFNSL